MGRTLLGVASILALVACSSTGSENIRNGGLQLQARAKSDATSTAVLAQVLVGKGLAPTRADLEGADQLWATLDGAEKQLAENKDLIFGEIWYAAIFPSDNGGKEATLQFRRKVDASLVDNKVVVPLSFEVTAPTAGAEFSRAAGLTVSWTPTDTGTTINLGLTGTCLLPYGKNGSADSGSLVVGTNEVKANASSDAGPATCTANLVMDRVRLGTIDKGWGEGGGFSGIQSRKVTVTSKP